MTRLSLLHAIPLILLASACAPREVPVEVRIANAFPAVNVVAVAETDPVGTAAADAADDARHQGVACGAGASPRMEAPICISVVPSVPAIFSIR